MKSISKILLLPMCGMGDAVCYVPTVQALRSHFPEARITVVVVSEVARTILDLAGCDLEVIVFNRGGEQRGWRALGRFVRAMRSAHYDVVISGAHPDSVRVPLVAAVCGAKMRVGADSERFSFLYDRTVDVETSAHAYDRFRSLLTSIGIDIPLKSYRPRIQPPEQARLSAAALWADAGLSEQDVVIGIASGADTTGRGRWRPYLKRWPTQSYVQLVRLMEEELGAKIVMFGGPIESLIAHEISTSSDVAVVNFCGKTSVQELGWLLMRCKAIVSNDTGIMHLAAAVGTPMVSLFGPTNPDSFAPVEERHRSLHGVIHCSSCYPHPTCDLTGCAAMDSIGVGRVLSALTEIADLPFRQRPLARDRGLVSIC